MDKPQQQSGFKDLLTSLMEKRWYVTAIVLGLFVLILLGIFVAIATGTAMAAEWKELLLLLLGAFIGSYGKIIDYYYSDADKDKMLVQKMDEEDGVTLSHTNDMKETNKVPTPIIPDAFIKGAEAARDLAVTENKQNFELAKDEQEHRQVMEIDQQEHKQEMEKLEFEYHAHRQCEHVWGDSDGDGELECQKCGLLKDK
jgi:phosphoglycerol transferase MdoB-like AlkP superfamily enzyme